MSHPRPLHGTRVAILVEDGFEESELTRPREALHSAGATTAIVSPQTPVVHAWRGDERDGSIEVELGIADAKPIDFDALPLPGGVRNADALRADNKADLGRDGFRAGAQDHVVAVAAHRPRQRRR